MNLMILEKLVDRNDRLKIKDRTQKNVAGYDYRLKLENLKTDEKTAFSFLVVGDTGGGGENKNMKNRVAEMMSEEKDEKGEKNYDLILHLGDVVYLTGAKKGYRDRFIAPYHHWLLNGKDHKYKNMVFNTPFLPIYGNHDYYDVSKILKGIGPLIGLFSQAVGSGSKNGKIFEKAFVEKRALTKLVNKMLPYNTEKQQTRIPNRYYWFTHGPCAFFALDSNTLDQIEEPSPGVKKLIEPQIKELEIQIEKQDKYVNGLLKLKEHAVLSTEQEDLFEDQLEKLIDQHKKLALLKKRLEANKADYDINQLAWLERVLKQVDKDPEQKWKIVYMHHSLYSSESGHTDDDATGGLRENLRRLFTKYKVDLVLSGHSHCFEWAKSIPAKDDDDQITKAECNICYIVSGGGGKGLRESILEGDRKDEKVRNKQDHFLHVAESKAFTAKLQIGPDKTTFHEVHNYLRIDVKTDVLTIIPKGVKKLNRNEAMRIDPFICKVFTKTSDDIDMNTKYLKEIKVYKDKEPEGVWVNKYPA